jgi:putative heme-binding domain-containing protein
MDAMLLSRDDRMQQIHYFYCLRLLHDGWTTPQKKALAAWYEGTHDWTGGHSFTPFLENIFRECLAAYDLADRRALLADAQHQPLVAMVLAQRLQRDLQPELLPELKDVAQRVGDGKGLFRGDQLRQEVADALVKTVLRDPSAKSFPYLVQGLTTTNRLLLPDVVEALQKLPAQPAKDDPVPYRLALLAANRLDKGSRWQVVKLLRHWGDGKQFGAEDGDWKQELGAWGLWFGQAFPKEAPLPNVAGDKPAESKYKYADLLTFLEKGNGKTGDAARGRVVFDKAQCIKCHKYGKEGEGVGPDLTTLSKRFKRADVLESIVYPSKVISDQYRSTTITTKKGRSVTGLAAVQGDVVTVLLSDGSKISLKKDEIEQQIASLISVMPEKLLDPLEMRDIADLFAYLESDPAK